MREQLLQTYEPLGYLQRVQDTSILWSAWWWRFYYQSSWLYKNQLIETIHHSQLLSSYYHTSIDLLMILVTLYSIAQIWFYYDYTIKREREVHMWLSNELGELNWDIKDIEGKMKDKEDNLFYKWGAYSHEDWEDDEDEDEDDIL